MRGRTGPSPPEGWPRVAGLTLRAGCRLHDSPRHCGRVQGAPQEPHRSWTGRAPARTWVRRAALCVLGVSVAPAARCGLRLAAGRA